MNTLICSCNQTLPLDAPALGAVLGETLHPQTTLCRRDVGQFLQALPGDQPLTVACTQEAPLFGELAQAQEVPTRPLRFVNLREMAGWGREGRAAAPKMAALLAATRLPEPEPVPTVSYRSQGRLLILGPLDQAQALARQWGGQLAVTVLATSGAAPADPRYQVLRGEVLGLTGWLGAFELRWRNPNPIDLDLCTRCNACIAACPESAIGLDYQVDLAACTGHRACVAACARVGAIDFEREAAEHEAQFDLVLDLRPQAAFSQHALPQGYVHTQAQDSAALLALRELVGEFEKPKFFTYRAKLCAHARNNQVGCSQCLDVCSASAIRSDAKRGQIEVNPHLCVGCGTCTTVCPTGALSYAYPDLAHQGRQLKTLLGTYRRAGGRDAVLLLHNGQLGQDALNQLGQAAQMDPRGTHGLPARVIPFSLWHAASVGLEFWLSALALGASQVWVLTTPDDAPQYRDALDSQMATAQALMSGLGYTGQHLRRLDWRDARDLAGLDAALQAPAAQGVAQPATFALLPDKRSTLALALDHLLVQAPPQPARPQALPLPTGAPLGGLAIRKEACTLCMSCVGACPAQALQDNPQQPQLRFVEKNCVQCGLCVRTCPEQALSLVPRWLLTPERHSPQVLHETQPYACVRCNKPFGTLRAIEAMLGKLADHPMFQGAALERLKMCGDCRVVDIYSSPDERRITDL